METHNRFYTYAYLREDRSPYYVGKGTGRRAYSKQHSVYIPSEEKIIILKKNITEEEAIRHEIYMIALFGRKDLGTGILHNKTDGGDGTRGILFTKEQREQISKRQLGAKNHFYGKSHTEVTKKKMRQSQSGSKHAMYGKKHNYESKKKISASIRGENHPLFNVGHSEETKLKMRESFKKTYIITYTDGRFEVVKGITEWMKENNLSSHSIKRLRNKEIDEYKKIISIEKNII